MGRARLLNKVFERIIRDRHTAFTEGKEYADLNDLGLGISIDWAGKNPDDEPKNFGVLWIGTQEVDGQNRVTLTLQRDDYTNTVILCDDRIQDSIKGSVKSNYDLKDTSFIQLCDTINEYVTRVGTWGIAIGNSIVKAIKFSNNNRNNNSNNGSGNYNQNNRYNDNDSNSPLFADDSGTF